MYRHCVFDDLDVVRCGAVSISPHLFLPDGRDITNPGSHEHDSARWVKASDMRALLSDEVITDMAGGNDDVARLLTHIRTDLDRYLARVQSG